MLDSAVVEEVAGFYPEVLEARREVSNRGSEGVSRCFLGWSQVGIVVSVRSHVE
jgi:hypothetical protein